MDVRREVDDLLASEHPSLRWKVRTGVLGEDTGSRSVRRLREEIRSSRQVRGLLEGHATRRPSAYAKWYGAHWVLQSLADLGYPEGADELVPLRDQVLGTWLASDCRAQGGRPKAGGTATRPGRCGPAGSMSRGAGRPGPGPISG